MAAKEALKLIATVNEESDVEVDDQLLSSSDDESEEEEKSRHQNVLNIVKNLNKKSSKRKRNQRCEPNIKVSEFHLSSGGDNEKVNIQDLIGSLQKGSQYAELKKKLESMENNVATLDVPLPQPEADKIQRTIAFEETSKEVSKWQPIVKKNREAEHLAFPLNAYKPSEITTKSLAVTFKPRTPLEEEIAAVLNGSSHLMERKNKELTEEEEQALLAMDLEEAKERRSELQRLRALQSYYEEKCRRAKKIKSKKYHKIKKKAEQRVASNISIEELKLQDPQKAAEELEKMDRIRAEERLSLKHRSTSKWAKNLLIRGHKDPEAKKAMQEQLELSRKLTEKQQVQSDSDDEKDNEEEEDTSATDPSSAFGSLKADINNPWGLDSNTAGDMATGFVQEDESTAFKRIPAISVQETTEKANRDPGEDSESAEDNPEDDFEIKISRKSKKGKTKSKKRKSNDQEWTEKEAVEEDEEEQLTRKGSDFKTKGKKVSGKGKRSKEQEEEEDDDEEQFTRKRSDFKTKGKKVSGKGKRSKEQEEEEDDDEEQFTRKRSDLKTKGKKVSGKGKRSKEQEEEEDEEQFTRKRSDFKTKGKKVSGKGKRSKEQEEEEYEEEDPAAEMHVQSAEESGNDREEPPPSAEPDRTPQKNRKSVLVDPNKIFQMEEYDSNKTLTNNPGNRRHILNIQQAFANDDVIEEFVREKEEAMEASKGKDLDLTLPGWGDWGGPGVKVSKKKKKKFVQKAEEPPPRQDRNLAHVIINEEKNKRLARLQVKTIPYLYTDAEQFEKSIRNPVGKDWNTGSTVKQLIKPRVQTLMGTIIEPIQPTKELKRFRKHSIENVASKKSKKKDEGLAIYS